MKQKIKPPAETKAQLMLEIVGQLDGRFPSKLSAYEYLLNFFSSADLVGIRDDLRRLDNNGVG